MSQALPPPRTGEPELRARLDDLFASAERAFSNEKNPLEYRAGAKALLHDLLRARMAIEAGAMVTACKIVIPAARRFAAESARLAEAGL